MGTSYEKVMIGVFPSALDARRAIEALRDEGFSDKKIGLLTQDKDGDPEMKSLKALEGNKAGAGAAIGASAGAGGGILWALGMATGVLPVIGPIVAGGILTALAVGAGAGAAAGAVVGSLIGLGVGDEEAAYYDDEFRKGRTIVLVQPGERGNVAYSILNSNNSQNPHMMPPEKYTAIPPLLPQSRH